MNKPLAIIISAVAIIASAEIFAQTSSGQSTLSNIRLSDPFILADEDSQMYYMTGTGGRLWNSY